MKIPNNKSGKLKICPVDIKLKYKPSNHLIDSLIKYEKKNKKT